MIRSGDWKLLEYFEDDHVEMYNLRDDPGESRDRASDDPARARALRGKLLAWRKEIGARLPSKNPAAAKR